jgi:hypothetical protein
MAAPRWRRWEAQRDNARHRRTSLAKTVQGAPRGV